MDEFHNDRRPRGAEWGGAIGSGNVGVVGAEDKYVGEEGRLGERECGVGSCTCRTFPRLCAEPFRECVNMEGGILRNDLGPSESCG